MDYARKDRADALAAQYVAGTLRGPARRRFEALLGSHPALRAAVADWQARLMPLTAVVAEEAPPARVWAGIERRLWPPAAAPLPLPWWRRLETWRAAAGLATVAALTLGVLLSAVPPQPPVIVVLQGTAAGADGTGPFVASFSGDGRALVTRPLQPVALAADRALELWAVPPSGAPRSLGLISAAGTTVIARDRLPRALLDSRHTAALAVSVEPPGGSPTGVPTGPVIYAGKLQL
ncbi:MAG: anti-sigma factor [Burkholderiaceae bacterium]|nr:anti-sigma factor [Burkholderiaceae bacterium]